MNETFEKYNYQFQIKIISLLLSDEIFLRDGIDIIKPEYFESEVLRWLCKTILNYFVKYGNKVTLEVLKIEIMKENFDDSFKLSLVEVITQAMNQLKSDELKFVKDEVLTFCRNQSMTSALMKSVDLLNERKYDDIMATMSEAMRVNASNDLGHDFKEDIDIMFDESARNCLETPWPIINEITDGGLGGGEMGIFIAATGAGKCIGPNTKIDIQYEEIGIEDENGDIKWYSPWEKIIINGIEKYAYELLQQ